VTLAVLPPACPNPSTIESMTPAAGPQAQRIFLSSTFYDLEDLRSEKWYPLGSRALTLGFTLTFPFQNCGCFRATCQKCRISRGLRTPGRLGTRTPIRGTD